MVCGATPRCDLGGLWNGSIDICRMCSRASKSAGNDFLSGLASFLCTLAGNPTHPISLGTPASSAKLELDRETIAFTCCGLVECSYDRFKNKTNALQGS